jgi:hypothetical protein
MYALLVFESMFGNTEVIARAIADGMSGQIRVEIVEVSSAPAEIGSEVALLVVGGPTHAFGMSRPQTRQDAARQASGQVVSRGSGIREWLAGVSCPGTVPAATFDTRAKQGWVTGSAARGAQKRLRGKGFSQAAAAQSFYVAGTPGPLLEGEVSRARLWGEELAAGLVIEEQVRPPS